jgi:ABC-2 type transport system permease protein
MTALAHSVPLTEATHSPARTIRVAARVTLLELRLLLREPGVLVGLVAFPAVTVLVLAGVFGSTPDPEFGGVRPSEHYVVGYIGVVLAQIGLVALPVHVASRREQGVRRRYRAAGLSAGVLVASDVALGVILGLAASSLVLVVGGAAYGMPVPEDPVAVAGWIAAGLLCFVSLGIALGTVLPTSRAASALGNLVFVPMFLLGGGGPPREVMTAPMRALSDVLPLSHVIGGLRRSWLGATGEPQALWWAILVSVVAVGLAVRSSRRRIA